MDTADLAVPGLDLESVPKGAAVSVGARGAAKARSDAHSGTDGGLDLSSF